MAWYVTLNNRLGGWFSQLPKLNNRRIKMAIAKQITFEGNKYNLGNKDRVAAHTALNGASIGAVTQSTDHTTEVTLNKQAGVITLAGVALNTNASAEFTFTNSEIKGTDSVIITGIQAAASGRTAGANLQVYVHTIAAGSCKVVVANTDDENTDSADVFAIHFMVINSGS